MLTGVLKSLVVKPHTVYSQAVWLHHEETPREVLNKSHFKG